MNCDWVSKNIQLYIYDELADDARYELEQHVTRCGECAKDLKSARKLNSLLSRMPVQEPSPNLLASSRMKLQDSLETAEQSGFWRRLEFDPWAWWREIRFAPAVAALIHCGLAGGIGGTYRVMKNHQPNGTGTPDIVESSVSGFVPLRKTPAQIKSELNTIPFPVRK
jgi:anti-sigma factor RsiW